MDFPCALGQWSGLELFDNNILDKLTLLSLSAELEMDDDDNELNLEEALVTVAIFAAST